MQQYIDQFKSGLTILGEPLLRMLSCIKEWVFPRRSEKEPQLSRAERDLAYLKKRLEEENAKTVELENILEAHKALTRAKQTNTQIKKEIAGIASGKATITASGKVVITSRR